MLLNEPAQYLNSIKLKCEEKWMEALNVILNWK
jgi:hypothetical protein